MGRLSRPSLIGQDHAAILLGGAERTSTRARGFIEWKPQRKTLELMLKVQDILTEYEAYLPLTIRQIFYRLVGKFDYEKTETSYGRLQEHLNNARRGRVVPFSAIRDDGGTVLRPPSWESAEEWLAVTRETAAELQLDRSAGQKSRLTVICEAAGMAPQLERVARPYGVTVMSGGGFDSTTDKYNFAVELTGHDRPTEVLHIGDHDPSGAHMFLAFLEDVEAFTRGGATFSRLAVTPTQIRDLGLPTAPPKDTDRRAFTGDTCQAEAIAPDDLAAILTAAIEARIDMDVYRQVLEREEAERRWLVERLSRE